MTGEHAFNSLHHVGFGRHDHVNVHTDLELHDADRAHVGRVRHGNRHHGTHLTAFIFALLHEQRHHLVLLTHVFGQVVEGVRVNIEIVELYVRDFELSRKNFDQTFFGHVAQVHQSAAKALTRSFLGFESLVQLFLRNVTLSEEHFTDTHLGRRLHLRPEDVR